ncbi:MAG: hypothetical protein ACYTDU_05455 [Planctomycetota bacterium]|jgi:hypothetical protein
MEVPKLGPDDFDPRRIYRIHDALKKAGFVAPPHVTFAVCQRDPHTANRLRKVDLDEVPIRGPVQFTEDVLDVLGYGQDFTSPLLESPTWLEIAVQAEAMIVTTGAYDNLALMGVIKCERRGGVTMAAFDMEPS